MLGGTRSNRISHGQKSKHRQITSPYIVCYASNFQHCNVQIHKTLSFDPDFLLVLNKWQCKDKILETRRLIILVVILLTMRVPSLWLYVFFSTHKMCWWLVISVSQFLQDLSKYRDALHGRKAFLWFRCPALPLLWTNLVLISLDILLFILFVP